MPQLLIVLDRTSYRQLQRLADSEERVVDQQARYLLLRALRSLDTGDNCLPPTRENPTEANIV